MNARVKFNDCKASNNSANHVQSLIALAQQAGKGTGIVTTTTVTHASPSGAYAHVSNRNFESDNDVILSGNDPNQCDDIAKQLVYDNPGKKLKVIFGGGRMKFLPKEEEDFDGNVGERRDGHNLIEQWLSDKPNGKYLSNKKDLVNLNLDETEQVLGLFSSGHMDFNLDADRDKQPNLVEMTEIAIKLLQKEKHGFFLFVEGSYSPLKRIKFFIRFDIHSFVFRRTN